MWLIFKFCATFIHDNIFSLIYKKCHPKSYHSDIKCHMTLNTILSVFNVLVESLHKDLGEDPGVWTHIISP